MQTSVKQKFNLKNKVAIVTGASKGIGESIARGLAEYGAKVVISSRNQEAVDQVANNLKKEGYDALGIACHVGDEDQLKKLVEETMNAYGGVDILVNNAATNPFYGPLDTMENALFDKIMDINAKAPFHLANLCYPIMKKSGGGSIINIASVEGMKPSVGLGLYSVSKAALIMLTKSQAVEWGKFGIRSNAICPGLIKTKFSSALWQNEKILDQVTRHLPAGRMAVPDEMAGLACFLASDASSYCTGSVFTADGGHMIAGGFN
ncbi:glucose 1-dehydrogenase [Arenibacter algicola]|uniref:Gluconate 5-dehydrogenase n=1 Tax=Arenibacter algicola TaxID=616991 RepID=A0A221UZN3_9FLAO|nr:glucose 1-dehydrogenase [Arenibacter algicola]ASO06351.1 gluconate 5-dehydrogenase [Arenibacter algicola]|tara:strand:+ start:682 stop:1470 length:789 start_codon:yes stop_codon:yes gene_type:complete